MKLKRIIIISMMFLFTFVLFSCQNQTSSKSLDETYVLKSAFIDSENITNEYNSYKITFKSDLTCDVLIISVGGITNRSSTYTFDGKFITEEYNNEKYIYAYNEDTITLDDQYQGIFYTFTKYIENGDINKPASVDFNSVLFGDSIDDTKIFNYCPAILMDKDEAGEDIMHIWYCTNKTSGVIMDHIGYRTAKKTADGKWLFSEQQIVLAPTPGTWDGRHTCDPAVIKGEFKMQGETYNYLMSYLGCVTEDYSKNETGIAVAKDPAGPWKKVDSINPIVPYTDPKILGDNSPRNTSTQWGTGMPALLSVDGKGDVLLFFVTSSRGTGIQRWDLSDLDNPKIIFDISRNNNGITNSQGLSCHVGIPDYAYDPVTKRFYIFGVTNEKNPPNITETLVNSHCVLAYIDNVESTKQLCDILQAGNYTWNVVGFVGPDQTGWDRNHNPGIVRDPYGYISDPSKIMVVVATGRRDYPSQNIFTYRLHGWTFDLN